MNADALVAMELPKSRSVGGYFTPQHPHTLLSISVTALPSLHHYLLPATLCNGISCKPLELGPRQICGFPRWPLINAYFPATSSKTMACPLHPCHSIIIPQHCPSTQLILIFDRQNSSRPFPCTDPHWNFQQFHRKHLPDHPAPWPKLHSRLTILKHTKHLEYR